MKDSYRVEPAATVEEQPLSKDLAIGKDTPGKPFFVLLSLFSLYIIWGGTYLAMRIGLNGFPPFLLAGVRFLIAGSILYAVLRLRGAAAPTRAQWIGSAIIGILLLAGGNGGVVFSEQWVASGLAAVPYLAPVSTNRLTISPPTPWVSQVIDNFSVPGDTSRTVVLAQISAPAPAAPTVALTDPVNAANVRAATVSGSGEAGTTANIRVDDADPAMAVTGMIDRVPGSLALNRRIAVHARSL